MEKLQKRYYVLAFIAAIAVAVIIRDFSSLSFKIIKTDTVYAPENDSIFMQNRNNDKVNINTANERLLGTLDGIGESMAQRIIKYRTKNGNFEVIEDIMKVEGIGEKKFDALKEYITVK